MSLVWAETTASAAANDVVAAASTGSVAEETDAWIAAKAAPSVDCGSESDIDSRWSRWWEKRSSDGRIVEMLAHQQQEASKHSSTTQRVVASCEVDRSFVYLP